ncbi:zinc finger protein 706-like [Penaeus monodon]|nr:zinc finger protein 706-like [Penaeus monodon]
MRNKSERKCGSAAVDLRALRSSGKTIGEVRAASVPPFRDRFSVMARGHQKAQSQAKNLAKQAAIKSKQGHNANAQKKAAAKALTYQCPVCRSMMPDPKTFKQHFENKHPGAPMPEELKDI